MARHAREPLLDVGAGTGIFTRQLAAAGLTVIAVEPVREMLTIFASQLPHVPAVAGTAEKLPFANASVETIVAAQAFHWFRYEAALVEIHRVLRPGGSFVTVWNVRDQSTGWMNEYERILAEYEDDTPRHSSMQWRMAIETDARFHLADDWGIDNPQPSHIDGVVRRALSTSFIAALPASQQEHVTERLRRLLESHGPDISIPYRSAMQAWQKL